MIYFAIALVILVLLYLAVSYLVAYGSLHLDRQPVPKTPENYGMKFEPVKFQAVDDVYLKGWLIPGRLQKIIIMAHVGGLTKYGSTVKFKSIFKLYNKEIEFLKTAENFHKAGYSILTFDLRNHGESDTSPNNGISGIGIEEYRDIAAALDFIKSRDDLRNMDIGFVGFCTGANSIIVAMSKNPGKFRRVKCLVAVQPISQSLFIITYVGRLFTSVGVALLLPTIKRLTKLLSGYDFEARSPKGYIKDIRVPTLYVQARNDPWTDLKEIQGFYDTTSAPKELFWIENTKHRFETYSYFDNNPEKILGWLEKWM